MRCHLLPARGSLTAHGCAQLCDRLRLRQCLAVNFHDRNLAAREIPGLFERCHSSAVNSAVLERDPAELECQPGRLGRTLYVCGTAVPVSARGRETRRKCASGLLHALKYVILMEGLPAAAAAPPASHVHLPAGASACAEAARKAAPPPPAAAAAERRRWRREPARARSMMCGK